MGWKQCTVPFATDPLEVQERLYAMAMTEAVAGRRDERVALLWRNDPDFKTSYWLLTPEAAFYADALPGNWQDVSDHGEHKWGVLYSTGVTLADLGLQSSADG